MPPPAAAIGAAPVDTETPYAWLRLAVCLALMTLGGAGMYVVTVVLPLIQSDFGVPRADASLPYTLTMVGFGLGGVLLGRLADRHGVMVTSLIGGTALGLGFLAAAQAPSLTVFVLLQGLCMGLLGTAASFAPLVADTARWFDRRRGIAVAICMSGNYVGGALWPYVSQQLFDAVGWRGAYTTIGLVCLATMLPLALVLRRRPPTVELPLVRGSQATTTAAETAAAPAPVTAAAGAHDPARPLGLSPATLQALLCVAGVSCCVAMAMPQVHIVAYCGDLGFGPARGAEMLSLMLGCGIVSRLVSGWIADRIGGLRTLLLGSVLQTIALVLFLPAGSLASLYVVSALFGLFQGGIVPSYPLVVREYFPAAQAGARVGTVLMATLLGMALGGWISGAIFDATGSYTAAFVNGIAWNVLNAGIVLFLLRRAGPLVRRPSALAAA